MVDLFQRLYGYSQQGRPALVNPTTSNTSRTVSYDALLERTGEIRDFLLRSASMSSLDGARVAIMLPPCSDHVAVLFAIWSLNAIGVPLCLSHPPQELSYTLSDSDASIVIYHPAYKAKLRPLLTGRTGIDLTSLTSNTTNRSTLDFSNLVLSPSKGALIVYTSGSTGRPKGAVHTHGSLQAQCQSLNAVWKITPQDRLIHLLPLHHSHGLVLSLVLPLFAGACIEFLEKFDDAATWNRLIAGVSGQPPITVMMAVPTIWVRMIQYFDRNLSKSPELATRAASNFRLAISGSAALPVPVRKRWADIAGGQLLLERYGMTETGIIYSGGLEQDRRIQGSVGWVMPGLETRLIADDGRDVSSIPDVVGEIQMRGKTLFKGYWRREADTAKEYTTDGWWKTGDMAMIKAEFSNACFIQGRASVDIIKSGGYKISALEIETELLSLPFIKEAAVVGVEDAVWGECVAAIVVLTEEGPQDLKLPDLRESLRSKLAPYKVPQRLRVIKEMPRNPMGKVNKKELRVTYFGDLTKGNVVQPRL